MNTTATTTATTIPAAAAAGSPDPSAARAELAARPVLAVAAVFVAVELAVASRYGLHRDELYFLACGRHLAWGYVDQPPLVPFVARITSGWFGTSAEAIRILPALVGGGAVVLTALIARELGGRSRAQTFAALGAATSPQVVAASHLLSTTTFDLFFWALLCWLLLRLLRTRDTRLWLALGAVAGVALLDKYNVGSLLVALVIGVLSSRTHRSIVLTMRFAVGALLASVIVAPNIAWNARHDWAAITMLHQLHAENSSFGASIGFIPSQLVVVGPALVVLWIAGLRRLLRSELGKPFGIAFLVMLVAYAVSGAKSYYLAGGYFALFAAGGCWYEERTRTAPRGRPIRAGIALTLATVAALPLALPVLPASALPSGSWESNINKDLSATVGWRAFVHQLARVAEPLPPTDRSRLVVLTGDYGAAGAVDLYGRDVGLPGARIGHNSYWWWGPGRAPDDSVTIAVNVARADLTAMFDDVTLVGHVATPHGVWTEERDAPIYLCRGQRRSWRAAWPSLRHYS